MRRRLATLASLVLLCGFMSLAPATFARRGDSAARANGTAAQQPPIAGGYREASTTDPRVLAAARFAVRAEGRRRGLRLRLVLVERAETQVVAGTNYRLRLSVSVPLRVAGRVPRAADVVESFDALVYENLRGRHSLTSWKAAREDRREEAQREVKVFLVALDDDGRKGRRIGCGDSLVPVAQMVNAPGGALLRAALDALLALPHDYGDGLKNYWRGENLRVTGVSLRGGVATVRIAGRGPFIAGVCDAPRITEQIRATARQFPSVRRVEVFVNGRTLASALR